MNRVGAQLHDPVLNSLFAEAKRNLAARHGDAAIEDLTHVESPATPAFDGKQCAVCKRPFRSPSEYLACKACPGTVCRKGDCKGLHQAAHHVAYLKQQRQEKQP